MNHPTHKSSGSILFADDDSTFRNGTALLLDRLGFGCHCVSTGAEALDALRATQFDAVLADINMPGNHDLTFVREAAEMSPALPVVLLTGSPAVETAAQSLQLPVVAYLLKPPDLDELKTSLQRAVRHYQRWRAVQACRKQVQRWDSELQSIECQLRDRPVREFKDANTDFIRLTLRNFIQMLVEFERTVAVLGNDLSPAILRQTELVNALRTTVTVLERTRQSFKSKDLGELRGKLERLLKGWE